MVAKGTTESCGVVGRLVKDTSMFLPAEAKYHRSTTYKWDIIPLPYSQCLSEITHFDPTLCLISSLVMAFPTEDPLDLILSLSSLIWPFVALFYYELLWFCSHPGDNRCLVQSRLQAYPAAW